MHLMAELAAQYHALQLCVGHVTGKHPLFTGEIGRHAGSGAVKRVRFHLDAARIGMELSEVQQFDLFEAGFLKQFTPCRLLRCFPSVDGPGGKLPSVLLNCGAKLADNRNAAIRSPEQDSDVRRLRNAMVDLRRALWPKLDRLLDQIHRRRHRSTRSLEYPRENR